MKLLKLGLRAFGPFADVDLDLSAGAAGLHVIYGVNEAGKSTSLRAVLGLLFGIPGNTRDDHVHAMNQLRIGGILRNRAGQELSFVRRKGNQGTLLHPDDDKLTLDDGELDRFLHGVDRKLFERLYGIDHERLISGGNELLAQTGDLGQALFSAALGTASLREVLDELEKTAADLYKPGGSKPTLNTAIRDYKIAVKEVRDAGLSANAWTTLKKDNERLDERLTELETQRSEVSRRRSELERARRVMPPMAQLDQAVSELAELVGVVLLPAGFGADLRETRERLRAATKSIERAREDLEESTQREAELDVSDPILVAAAAVEAVQQDLGVANINRADKPNLEGQVRQLRNEAWGIIETSWPGLSLEQAEQRRPLLERRPWIQELATEHAGLAQRAQAAQESLREANEALGGLEDVDKELLEADPGPLRAAVTMARQAGDLSKQLSQAEGKLKAGTLACERDLGRLALFRGSLDDLNGLALPGGATIDRFEEQFGELKADSVGLEGQRKKLAAEREAIDQNLRIMLEAGDVPTEAQLAAVRGKRQDGWQRIRRRWIEQRDGEAGQADDELPDAYERSVQQADDIADRLRREAARVEKHASLAAQQQGNAAERQRHQSAEEERGERQKKIEAEWNEVWAGCSIPPRSPREMQGWLRQAEKLREALTARQDALGEADGLRQEIDRHSEAVAGELVKLGRHDAEEGEALSALLGRADRLVGKVEQARQQHQQRGVWDKQVAQAGKNAKAVDADQLRWRGEWSQAIELLDLPDDSPPSRVLARLGEIERLFTILKQRDQLLGRIRGIEKRLAEFSEEVARLAERVGMHHADTDDFELARQLQQALADTRTAKTSQESLIKRREKLQTQLRDAEADKKDLSGHLEQLRLQAQVDSETELEQAEQRSTDRARLEQRMEELARQVLDAGDGLSLQALRDELQDIEADTIPAEVAGLAGDQKRFTSEIDQLREERGALSAKILAHDGSAGAAEAAERAEEELAEIRGGLRRYLLARAQAAILSEEIEAYRRKNQGPVLKRASELFKRLTLGSFDGLRDELDDKSKPIILGLRDDGTEVDVVGMSDGTRDQLYLALRLATLEEQLATSEPMPFIVDDVLIGFDDARTKTCLEVLGELATKTQVLLFTHHRAVVEQASSLTCAAGVHVHRLESPADAGEQPPRSLEE